MRVTTNELSEETVWLKRGHRVKHELEKELWTERMGIGSGCSICRDAVV